MPAKEIRRAWEASTDAERADYDRLAKRFKVSAVVIARRLTDLGYMTRPAFHRFYTSRTSAERSAEGSGGMFYSNLESRIGRSFGNAVVQAVRGGRTTYSQAYALTDLRGDTFDKFAADFGS